MINGWREFSLHECADVLDTQRKPVNSYERQRRVGKVPYYGATGQAGWIDSALFNEPLVLLGEDAVDFSNPFVDKAYRIDGPSWVNNHAHVLRAREDLILTDFLCYSLNQVDYSDFASFGTRSKLTQGKMVQIKIPVPSLSIQRRIVDLITHLDNHLRNLRTERDAAGFTLGSLRSSFMKTSSDWNFAPLSDVAEVRLGRMLSKERANGEDLAPYIRNANVQWNGLGLEDLKTMSFPARERATYALRAGDILVCEGGDPGRAVILHSDLPGIFYQKAIHRLRVSNKSVLPGYLYHWLAECHANERIGDLCTNTTIKHLTAEKFRTLLVHWPSIEQQTEITNTLDDARTLIDRFTDEIEALEQVRSKTLSVLLAGTHTTPESYDVLLFEVA